MFNVTTGSFDWSPNTLLNNHLICLYDLPGTQEEGSNQEKDSHQKEGCHKKEAQHQEEGHQEEGDQEISNELVRHNKGESVLIYAQQQDFIKSTLNDKD